MIVCLMQKSLEYLNLEKISIILPVYNAEKTVEKTILSIIKQKKITFELIIINDGSNDGTSNILNKYSNNRNIKVFFQKNKGVSAARNKGIHEATGKYCFFIDSDDYLEEDALYKMLNLAEKHGLDLVCCSHEEFNSTSTGLANEQSTNKNIVMHSDYDVAKYYNLLFVQSACAKLFSLKLIRKYKLYFDSKMNLGEDLNFTLNFLLYTTNIGYVGLATYYVNNINPFSLSKKYSDNLERDIEIQYNVWEKLISQNNYIENEYKKNHIDFNVYLLKVYFGNLFRPDSPLSKKNKIAKINNMLAKHSSWIDTEKLKEVNSKKTIDKVSAKVIFTKNSLYIFFFFSLKEKLRRLKFFVGRKRRR